MRLYATKLVALLLPFKEALQEQFSYAYISDEQVNYPPLTTIVAEVGASE